MCKLPSKGTPPCPQVSPLEACCQLITKGSTPKLLFAFWSAACSCWRTTCVPRELTSWLLMLLLGANKPTWVLQTWYISFDNWRENDPRCPSGPAAAAAGGFAMFGCRRPAPWLDFDVWAAGKFSRKARQASNPSCSDITRSPPSPKKLVQKVHHKKKITTAKGSYCS